MAYGRSSSCLAFGQPERHRSSSCLAFGGAAAATRTALSHASRHQPQHPMFGFGRAACFWWALKTLFFWPLLLSPTRGQPWVGPGTREDKVKLPDSLLGGGHRAEMPNVEDDITVVECVCPRTQSRRQCCLAAASGCFPRGVLPLCAGLSCSTRHRRQLPDVSQQPQNTSAQPGVEVLVRCLSSTSPPTHLVRAAARSPAPSVGLHHCWTLTRPQWWCLDWLRHSRAVRSTT